LNALMLRLERRLHARNLGRDLRNLLFLVGASSRDVILNAAANVAVFLQAARGRNDTDDVFQWFSVAFLANLAVLGDDPDHIVTTQLATAHPIDWKLFVGLGTDLDCTLTGLTKDQFVESLQSILEIQLLNENEVEAEKLVGVIKVFVELLLVGEAMPGALLLVCHHKHCTQA